MKLLVAFRHRKAVEPFVDALLALRARGHDVTIGVHERDDRVRSLFPVPEQFEFVTLPDGRRDAWTESAELARHVRDVAQYLDESYRGALKLRRRVFDRLLKLLAVPNETIRRWSPETLYELGPEAIRRLRDTLGRLEVTTPPDPITEQALRRLQPDAVLVTPLMHFGSTQVELVKAARAQGIPVGMLLFSWDNLSTKGALHVSPDHLFVWNERQRQEAANLHGYPASQVSITGAPRFDRFFRLRSGVAHDAFVSPLGVEGSTPIVLYLCSSKLVSGKEVNFLRQWVEALRASASEALRTALVVVRPHPDVPLAQGAWLGQERTFRWPGFAAEPRTRMLFGDPRTLTLTSDYDAPQMLFESIFHSSAVVGLNTSAEIEAAIVGRPVFTVLADEAHADGQHATLHFHYLMESQGGFVNMAGSLDAHLAELAREIESPTPAAQWHARVEAFVRPGGWNRPASEVLAEAVEDVFARRPERVDKKATIPQPRVTSGMAAPPGERKVARDARAGFVRVEGTEVELWAPLRDGHAPRLDPGQAAALAWMIDRLTPGAVVYDLTAGSGLLTVGLARGLAATVVAFEPNLAALHALWQNVLANACDGLVIPLMFRPSSRSSLAQDRFDRFDPEAMRVSTRATHWREHDAVRGDGIIQPVLTMPLEWVSRRWKLPVPDAVCAVVRAPDADVLGAIESVMTEPRLKAIVLMGASGTLRAGAERLAAAGFKPIDEALEPDASGEATLLTLIRESTTEARRVNPVEGLLR